MSTSDGTIIGMTTLRNNGSRAVRFNLIIMSDGYRATEMAKFASDANAFLTTLFATPPWDTYASAVNVFRVDVTSTDSGADNPRATPPIVRATYFDSSFWTAGIERLLAANATTAIATAVAQVPGCFPGKGSPSQVLVLVNDAKYGGAGGDIATASTAPESKQIAIHELGHSAFGLADEYCGAEAVPSVEPAPVNVTIATTLATLKWSALVPAGTAIPTTSAPMCNNTVPSPVASGVVGAFEGGHRTPSGVFRPQFDCYMRTLGVSFCAVCSRQARKVLDDRRILPRDKWSGKWGTDWSHFVPIDSGGTPHLVSYKTSTGDLSIDRVRPDGKGTDSLASAKWRPGWTTFMPFVLGGQPNFLLYRADTGSVYFERVDFTNPAVPTIVDGYSATWTPGWSHFMPITLGGEPHYVGYKDGTGDITIDKIRADGSGVDTIYTTTWRPGWTHFTPFVLGGLPHFLLYRIDTGEVYIERIHADGKGFDDLYTATWTTGWSSFFSFVVAGMPHYLTYKAGTGDLCIERFRSDGSRTDTLWIGRWTTDWSHFVPFVLGGEPYHLCYKTTTGDVATEYNG